MPAPTRLHRPGSIGAAIALLITFCVVLTGCMQLEANLSVATDGRVSGNTVVALSNRLLDQSGQRTQVVGGLFDAASTPLIPAGATRLVDRYESNGYSGVRVTFTNYPVDSLPLASVGGASNSAKLTREDDKFRFEAVIDLGSASGVVDARQIDDARLSVRITFPGIVTEANGSIDGRTVTYTPKVGEVNRFTALAGAEPTTETGSSRTAAVTIGIALAVVLAIAVAVLALRGRKRSKPSARSATNQGPQSSGASSASSASDLSDPFDLREPHGSPPPLVAPPRTAPSPRTRVPTTTPPSLPPPEPSAIPGQMPPPQTPPTPTAVPPAPAAPAARPGALPPPAPAFPPPSPSRFTTPTQRPTPPASTNGTSGSNGEGNQRPSSDFQPPRS
ncbi:MAG: hypothetical protein AB7L13_10540 [Acidimicrobiia bacterium]